MREYVRRIICLLVLVMSGVYLSGCASDPVAEDLSQTQATTVVATLTQHGVPAQSSRDTGSRGRYSVTVRHQWYSEAVTILHEQGLPKQEEMTFADTIASHGFLPNSREIEALRIDRAHAAEIEEAIRINPAVQQVRAIVRHASLAEGGTAGVSVVAELKSGMSVNTEDLRSIIMKAIPGVGQDNVFVSTVSAQVVQPVKEVQGIDRKEGRTMYVPLSPFLEYWRVADGDVSGLSLALLVGFVVIGIIGGFLGYWYGYLQQTRVLPDSGLPDIPKVLRQLERPARMEIQDEEE